MCGGRRRKHLLLVCTEYYRGGDLPYETSGSANCSSSFPQFISEHWEPSEAVTSAYRLVIPFLLTAGLNVPIFSYSTSAHVSALRHHVLRISHPSYFWYFTFSYIKRLPSLCLFPTFSSFLSRLRLLILFPPTLSYTLMVRQLEPSYLLSSFKSTKYHPSTS